MNMKCDYQYLKDTLLEWGCPLDKIDSELEKIKKSEKKKKTKVQITYSRTGKYKSLDIHNLSTGATLVLREDHIEKLKELLQSVGEVDDLCIQTHRSPDIFRRSIEIEWDRVG